MLNENSFVSALKHNQWTVHYIGANPKGSAYHNCIVNPNVNIISEQLLVRFAYTIFQRRELGYFLDRNPEVHVRLQVGIESSFELNASINWSQNPKLHHAAVHDCNLVVARNQQLRIRDPAEQTAESSDKLRALMESIKRLNLHRHEVRFGRIFTGKSTASINAQTECTNKSPGIKPSEPNADLDLTSNRAPTPTPEPEADSAIEPTPDPHKN